MKLKLTITIEEGDDADRVHQMSRNIMERANDYITGAGSASLNTKGDQITLQVTGAALPYDPDQF